MTVWAAAPAAGTIHASSRRADVRSLISASFRRRGRHERLAEALGVVRVALAVHALGGVAAMDLGLVRPADALGVGAGRGAGGRARRVRGGAAAAREQRAT